MIVAPHPDDETIGAHGLIATLVRRGARVRVVVVADGAASHPASLRWPSERLVHARRAESRRALRRLGVGVGNIAFLGLPDGALDRLSPPQVRALARAIARRRCDLLVLPDARDDHPDHRAVARIATTVASRARRLGYMVWGQGERATRGPALGLVLRSGQTVKRHAIARYATQMGRIIDDRAGFAISRDELASFSRPIERFSVVGR